MALRADPARGDICLVVPKRVSEKTAWKFATDNIGWIEARLSRMQKPVPFAHDSVLPIFGQERRIVVTRTGGRTTACTLTDTTLEVHTPRENPANNIKAFLLDQLLETIRPAAEAKARSIGKAIRKITLRDTRTRWGSCGPDGNLMLCWRLVFAPMQVIDYVVAHEVAHLQHLDHSRRFWELCHQLSDDMHGSRAWLEANGDSLLRYGLRP
ncbi:MAG: M48 family metallopeptidase [Alphaproteobacteria bacterium]|nr:M48 family metallopeptidase [Alphaproteobacteria bacterium]